MADTNRNALTSYSFNRDQQKTGKMDRRLAHAVDEAAALAQMAREISATLTGNSPPDTQREPAPPSSKGIFANIDHQALQIEKRLEETRAALEMIKAHL